jgi:Integrase core domain
MAPVRLPLPARVKLFAPFCSRREASAYRVIGLHRRSGRPPRRLAHRLAFECSIELAILAARAKPSARPAMASTVQMARNATMEGWGALRRCRYLLRDRDTKYSAAFRAIVETGHVRTLSLPARSPNLNAYAERWVRSVKDECLSKVILFGDRSLRRAVSEYVAHYHTERNHQGKSNALLFPDATEMPGLRPVRCRERLGGLLRYYHKEAA